MSGRDFFMGFIFGSITGTLISLKAEGKTTQDIAELYEEIKDRVMEETSRIKGITKETYDHIVNSIVTGYRETKRITVREAGAIKSELKTGFDKVKKAPEGEHKTLSVSPTK